MLGDEQLIPEEMSKTLPDFLAKGLHGRLVQERLLRNAVRCGAVPRSWRWENAMPLNSRPRHTCPGHALRAGLRWGSLLAGTSRP